MELLGGGLVHVGGGGGGGGAGSTRCCCGTLGGGGAGSTRCCCGTLAGPGMLVQVATIKLATEFSYITFYLVPVNSYLRSTLFYAQSDHNILNYLQFFTINVRTGSKLMSSYLILSPSPSCTNDLTSKPLMEHVRLEALIGSVLGGVSDNSFHAPPHLHVYHSKNKWCQPSKERGPYTMIILEHASRSCGS